MNAKSTFSWRALTLAASLTFAISAMPTMAQEIAPEHLEAAKQAVTASQSTTSLDDLLPNMAEDTKRRLIDQRPDAAEQITAIVDDVAIELASRRGVLEVEVATGYAKIFSADELKAITAFYQSEAGAKLIRETPVIGRSIDQAARVWAQGIQRDMQDMATKKMEEAGIK